MKANGRNTCPIKTFAKCVPLGFTSGGVCLK